MNIPYIADHLTQLGLSNTYDSCLQASIRLQQYIAKLQVNLDPRMAKGIDIKSLVTRHNRLLKHSSLSLPPYLIINIQAAQLHLIQLMSLNLIHHDNAIQSRSTEPRNSHLKTSIDVGGTIPLSPETRTASRLDARPRALKRRIRPSNNVPTTIQPQTFLYMTPSQSIILHNKTPP